MSVLALGLTPKMKPLPAKRSALVAALDVGTSKIACLIGQLKPQEPQDELRQRSHAISVLGFGHTVASGMKAGVSISPCAVASRPRRAAPSRASNENPTLMRPAAAVD